MNRKRTDIQGLRGWAILLVIAFHFFPKYFPTGYTGVDVFFVLSGFLVAMILYREDHIGLSALGKFYYRRVDNLFVHCWSLSAEMQWYFIAPLLILCQKLLLKQNRLFFFALMQQLAYHESVRWETTMKNLATPGCKYSTRFVGSNIEPFGLCELERGTGNLSVLVIGNSFACNQADMVYKAFKRISSTFHVFCLNGCEVLSTTPEEKCKVKVNYEEIYEQLKPNLLFVLDRSFEAKTRVSDCHACNSDTLYMQQLYNLVLMENYADKVFILEAMPSCELSCATLALDFMTFLITKDDEYARIRHEELRKRCRKCELIDYVPALSDKDGVYRGYDPETNIMYLDESNHLNRFGKERLQPLFDDLAERTEKDLRA
ncbi:unnamed protein product [Nippostrongylus brasiliensis]|uniref:Acyl_transf_3 domain-containing protein n=1 Tax=Nippostrongylus brasiliensis TaxID=27835 RepID=A0A0N4XZ40_NIPBR|nr:unnamed protein product [Nippostrongylus brasiliensis]